MCSSKLSKRKCEESPWSTMVKYQMISGQNHANGQNLKYMKPHKWNICFVIPFMGMKQSCVTSVGVWNLSIVTRVQTSHLILWPFFPFTMTDMMDFKETFRNPFIKEATKVGKDFQPHETLRSHARKTTVWSVTPVFALALMLSHFIKRNFIQTNHNAKDGVLKPIN